MQKCLIDLYTRSTGINTKIGLHSSQITQVHLDWDANNEQDTNMLK